MSKFLLMGVTDREEVGIMSIKGAQALRHDLYGLDVGERIQAAAYQTCQQSLTPPSAPLSRARERGQG